MRSLLKTLAFLSLFFPFSVLAQQQIPITGGVVTADLSSGLTSFKVNLNQNVSSVVLTGQHPGSGGNTVICTLFFVQDATGGWTVTFGGNITGGFRGQRHSAIYHCRAIRLRFHQQHLVCHQRRERGRIGNLRQRHS